MTDFYEILEVEKTSSEDEIKRAYRRLALKWHPDKNLTNKVQAEEKFKLISEAYEILSDKDKRRKYDQLGRAGLSNGNSGYNGFSQSRGGYGQFSEEFLNRTFHFHNPFDIFEQFMSHFGMEDDFGFGSSPFADLHHHVHRHRVTPQNSSSSRRTVNPHRQQMALFDNFFSPMRMSVFDHHHHQHHDPFDMLGDSFGHGSGVGTISSFNFTSGGGARPIARKTTKSTRMVNGRRVVTTRTEENGQTTEVIEEDGQVTSRKINGITQAIK